MSCTMCMSSTHRIQKMELKLLQLKLQTVVRCHMGILEEKSSPLQNVLLTPKPTKIIDLFHRRMRSSSSWAW